MTMSRTGDPWWTLTAVPQAMERPVLMRVHDLLRTQDWLVGSIDEVILVQERPATGPVELLDETTHDVLAAVSLPDAEDVVVTFGTRPAADRTPGWWMTAKPWHAPMREP